MTKLAAENDLSRQPEAFFKQKITSSGFFLNSIGAAVSSFIATGNFQAKFCSDLQQESGFVILAEKLNHLRYTAHFRCVHRGAYFQEMKTTTVRKLMPESWGFMCPVHTPDGAPCGLLNHLTADCIVDAGWWDVHAHHAPLLALLESLGLISASRPPLRSKTAFPVLLDGRVAGELPDELLPSFVSKLRSLKRSGAHPHVSPHLEIVTVPRGGTQYPGVWLCSGQGRPMRAVRSLIDGKIEFIGSAEQPYLDIAVDATSVTPRSQYVEQSPVSMLSLVARLTPFCDFNQRSKKKARFFCVFMFLNSPRNIYQCQMAKQTMGVPVTQYALRSDNKMYRLTYGRFFFFFFFFFFPTFFYFSFSRYGQKPMVRTQTHLKYEMDNYPNGLNAVVAVLAYTGYDLEDAMIINKASHDRGIAQASVYYSLPIDLRLIASQSGFEPADLYFDNSEGPHRIGPKEHPHVDSDGMPAV